MKRIVSVPLIFYVCCLTAIADETVPDDRTITFWVGEALREDPRVFVADIDISTTQGVVKLSGTVTTLMQQRYAAAIASKIRGVVQVENNLEVWVAPRSDEEIQKDVLNRLRLSTGVRIQDLEVTCREGQVNVRGIVESAGYRAEAINMASEVQGVREVHNAISIRPSTQRTDREIEDELSNTFFRDVYLTGVNVAVQCSGGEITLSGTVGNAYLRDRAVQLAQNTANVLNVINKIEINRLMERGERRIESAPTDDELASGIDLRLASDPHVDSTNISVQASNGHVTLRGNVSSMRQRQLAEVTARQVAGAVWVTNLISVRSALRSDRELTAELVERLAKDVELRGRRIDVAVEDGVVFLSGVVTTHLPRMRAAEIAGQVAGVRGIRNNIEVRWTSLFRDPALKQHVVTRLRANWETTYAADRIQVTVTDGHVILTGDVDTWAQRREAGRMAFLTSGIRSVQNRLTINGVKYPWEEWNPENGPEAPADWIHQYRGDFLERPDAIRS